MKENKYLKWLLIVQSFLPLFFLVIIRCYNKIRGKMILDFILELKRKRREGPTPRAFSRLGRQNLLLRYYDVGDGP